jgi:anti-sigma factor RsiW
MSCEKYSGWMIDAALGELAAERQPELLAHAMDCEACREALGHARKVRELVERSVESMVAGDPAPGFEMRLRSRVAREARPVESYWTAWTPLAAGAVAVAVFLIFITSRTARRSEGKASVASTASTFAPAVASPSAASESVANPMSVRAPGSARATERAVRRRSTRADTSKIVVPDGQLAAAARLSDAINSGRVDGRQLLAAQQDYQQPLAVKPIEIAPLENVSPDEELETPVAPLQF